MEKNYFEWNNDYKYPTPDNIAIPEAWRKSALFVGRKINKALPEIELFFQKKVTLSDSIPNSELLLVFNKKLVDFMIEVLSDKLIQTIPVKVMTARKEDDRSYFLVNVLNTRDVIDKKKSDLDVNKYGEIDSINKLHIKEDFRGNNDIFRLEGYASLLICSNSFVSKIKDKGFTGMKFVPIGESLL